MRITLFFLFLIIGIVSCTTPSETEPAEYIPTTGRNFTNQQKGYSESVMIINGDVKTIYVSGQISDAPDFESQMRDILAKLEKALNNVGADMKDIVKMNTYIVDYQPEQLEVFRNVRKEVMGDEKMPASTLVGVTALARPEWLIEIDAVAVVTP
ncbi:MAG: RidA family protein [Bacteroidota bacterium]